MMQTMLMWMFVALDGLSFAGLLYGLSSGMALLQHAVRHEPRLSQREPALHAAPRLWAAIRH